MARFFSTLWIICVHVLCTLLARFCFDSTVDETATTWNNVTWVDFPFSFFVGRIGFPLSSTSGFMVSHFLTEFFH